jgi:uncharacterized protein (DUF488 family)
MPKSAAKKQIARKLAPSAGPEPDQESDQERGQEQDQAPDQEAGQKPSLTIFTIGHSTHPLEEFVDMLKANDIAQLVDVRTIPKSRRVPQFNSESLAAALPKLGIDYVHLKSLGGLRHAKKDSVNTGWRNASFRGYADYMGTDEFRQGIDRLLKLAHTKRTVIMCAEAVPWRCHRSLIGDALLVRGVRVEDIMSATSHREHELTPFAKVHGLEITYPGDGNQELFPK